jgi:hypothetical protein
MDPVVASTHTRQENPMRDMIRATSLFAFFVLAAAPLSGQTRQSQVNAELGSLKDAGVKACSLLTNAEIRKVTGRNQPYELNEDPYDQNSLCDYSGIVTIRLYTGDQAQASIDATLKNYKVTDRRMPISGFGNGAFLMYPTPRDKYADTVAQAAQITPWFSAITAAATTRAAAPR